MLTYRTCGASVKNLLAKSHTHVCDYALDLRPWQGVLEHGCAVCDYRWTTKVEEAIYTAYEGLEIIDLTEQMNFNRSNAVKYITRAGLKDKTTEVEDLKKARWYIDREIQRITKEPKFKMDSGNDH